MAYPVGALAGSNHLTISRNSNGQVVVQAKNMQNRDMGFLGEVTGSAQITLGNTDGGYGTAHIVRGSSGTVFNINDASQNIAFTDSSNLAINLLDNNNEANIQLNNVHGSILDATNTSRALTLETTASSSNNIFNMGWADAYIVDGGSYNVTSLGSGNASYISTTTNNGAVVLGGSGKADYLIAGNYGVFQQGTGYATYQINAYYVKDASGDDDAVAGQYNAILSNNMSYIKDQGYRSLLVSKNSASMVEMNGQSSIGSFGQLALFKFGENADDCVAMAGGKFREKFKGVEESSSTTYDFGALLMQNGFTNDTELDKSGNHYFGANGAKHEGNITASYIRAYTGLSEYLKMGSAYALTI